MLSSVVRRSPVSGLHAVGDGPPQIKSEPRHEPLRSLRNPRRGRRNWLVEHPEQAAAGRGSLFGRGGRRFLFLDVPPLGTFRRVAAAAARALRVAERQPHLEREIGAQEVGKVGAVGANDEPLLVFAQTQMVEQEIALPIAQHFMQRRPRRFRVERRRRTASRSMRNTGFPSRGSMYRARARRFPTSRAAAAAGHGAPRFRA